MLKKGIYFHDKMIGILFIIPVVGLLFFTSLYPLIYSLILSFFKYDLTISKEMEFVGFQNYIIAFKDKYFLYSFFITIIFVIVTVAIEVIIGLIVALLFAREGKRLRIARSLILIPMVITPVVVGILWRVLLNPDFGLINYFFTVIGLAPKQWLGDPKIALISVMIADIWEWTPFVTLCFVAGITSLSSDLFEAARIDGANDYQLLRHIMLPLLKPVIIVTILLRTLDAFKVVDTVYVMTYGGPGNSTKLMSLFIYERGLKYFRIGYASAISWIFLIFMFFFSFYLIRQRQRAEEF
jgi:multiple sugar transport system permease protein